jgi:glutaredoxin 3
VGNNPSFINRPLSVNVKNQLTEENSMPEIVIYSTAMCPYCVRAKMLLQRKGMQWEEKRIDLDHDLMSEMLQRSKRRTVPQIFIDDHHVGGFDDMANLDAMGRLDPMLGLIPPRMPGDAGHTIDASEDAPT